METTLSNPTINDYVTELSLYLEKSTSRLYEIKPLEEEVLARPILPALYSHVRRLTLAEFGTEFEEYTGDRSTIRKFLRAYHPVAAGVN